MLGSKGAAQSLPCPWSGLQPTDKPGVVISTHQTNYLKDPVPRASSFTIPAVHQPDFLPSDVNHEKEMIPENIGWNDTSSESEKSVASLSLNRNECLEGQGISEIPQPQCSNPDDKGQESEKGRKAVCHSIEETNSIAPLEPAQVLQSTTEDDKDPEHSQSKSVSWESPSFESTPVQSDSEPSESQYQQAQLVDNSQNNSHPPCIHKDTSESQGEVEHKSHSERLFKGTYPPENDVQEGRNNTIPSEEILSITSQTQQAGQDAPTPLNVPIEELFSTQETCVEATDSQIWGSAGDIQQTDLLETTNEETCGQYAATAINIPNQASINLVETCEETSCNTIYSQTCGLHSTDFVVAEIESDNQSVHMSEIEPSKPKEMRALNYEHELDISKTTIRTVGLQQNPYRNDQEAIECRNNASILESCPVDGRLSSGRSNATESIEEDIVCTSNVSGSSEYDMEAYQWDEIKERDFDFNGSKPIEHEDNVIIEALTPDAIGDCLHDETNGEEQLPSAPATDDAVVNQSGRFGLDGAEPDQATSSARWYTGELESVDINEVLTLSKLHGVCEDAEVDDKPSVEGPLLQVSSTIGDEDYLMAEHNGSDDGMGHSFDESLDKKELDLLSDFSSEAVEDCEVEEIGRAHEYTSSECSPEKVTGKISEIFLIEEETKKSRHQSEDRKADHSSCSHISSVSSLCSLDSIGSLLLQSAGLDTSGNKEPDGVTSKGNTPIGEHFQEPGETCFSSGRQLKFSNLSCSPKPL